MARLSGKKEQYQERRHLGICGLVAKVSFDTDKENVINIQMIFKMKFQKPVSFKLLCFKHNFLRTSIFKMINDPTEYYPDQSI